MYRHDREQRVQGFHERRPSFREFEADAPIFVENLRRHDEQRLLYLANALDTFYVGLKEIDDGIWSIYFGTVLAARFDERDGIIRE